MENQTSNNTKLRLIHAAKKLLAQNNFDAISTRTLAAEAGVGQSAIFFHFGSKDKLCAAVIDDILSYHKIYYGPINEKINNAYDSGIMTPDLAFELLCEFIKIQVEIAADPHNKYALCFSVNGYTLPKDMLKPLDDDIFNSIECPMTRLLCSYKQSDNTTAAHVICHALNTSIFAYSFTSPGTSVMEAASLGKDPNVNTEQLKQLLLDYSISSIKAASL